MTTTTTTTTTKFQQEVSLYIARVTTTYEPQKLKSVLRLGYELSDRSSIPG